MERTPPKTDTQARGATCYTPPRTIKADVYTTPTGAAPTSSDDDMSRLLRETSPGPGSGSSWVVRARCTR